MPDAPMASMDDLTQMYRQQNPGQPLPLPGPGQVQGGDIGDPNSFAGSSKAFDMLSRYNQFLQQQQSGGGAAAGGGAQGTGGQPTMTPGGVGGPQQQTQPTARAPAAGGGQAAPPPQPGGGYPPVDLGGQGVIPAGGVGITPSAGLNNGNSLPAAQPGGSNLRIMNGQQTQDVQYSPTAGGGVQATTMRDAGTGVTMVLGPNGQFYPSGTTMQGPGQSFANANTNLTQLGDEQAAASRWGLTPDVPTLTALRQMKLMGASPNSPIGQQVLQRTLEQYNQNQTELEKARIVTQPENRKVSLLQDQFSKEDRKAYDDTYKTALKRMNSEDATLPLGKRRSEDEKATQAQREADQELGARQGSMGGPASVRGSAQGPGLGTAVPAQQSGVTPTTPPGGGPLSMTPGDPGALNQAVPKVNNAIKAQLQDIFRSAKNDDNSVDGARFVQALQSMPGLMKQGVIDPDIGAAMKDILAKNPQYAQGLRGSLASHFLNMAGGSAGVSPFTNYEMAGMVGGAAPNDSALGMVGGGGPGKSSPTQAFGVGSILGGLGVNSAMNAMRAGATTAAAGAAAPTLTPGAVAPAAAPGLLARAMGVGGSVAGSVPGQLAGLEAAASPLNRVPGEGLLSAMNPANTHLGVWDTLNNEYIAANPQTRNTSIGNWLGGSLPQAQANQQMMTTALLMRYLRPGQ